eukprot:2820759-Rhodomonas_salina.2
MGVCTHQGRELWLKGSRSTTLAGRPRSAVGRLSSGTEAHHDEGRGERERVEEEDRSVGQRGMEEERGSGKRVSQSAEALENGERRDGLWTRLRGN